MFYYNYPAPKVLNFTTEAWRKWSVDNFVDKFTKFTILFFSDTNLFDSFIFFPLSKPRLIFPLKYYRIDRLLQKAYRTFEVRFLGENIGRK